MNTRICHVSTVISRFQRNFLVSLHEKSYEMEDKNKFKAPSVKFGPMTESYTYHSPTPTILLETQKPCVLGVDEAGRGPVLGPMCFGIAYCAISEYEKLIDEEYKDSKKLDETKRELLLQRIINNQDYIGWGVRSLSPRDISTMTIRDKINLNVQSHSATIQLIRDVIITGVNIKKIYVDTVGPPEKYRNLLAAQFPQQEIIVEKAADDKFPIVSAASICAKVTRDHILRDWSFIEENLTDPDLYKYGSGYPNEKTRLWLERNVYPNLFGFYPSIVRWHWKPARQILYNKGMISLSQVDNPTWPGLEDTVNKDDITVIRAKTSTKSTKKNIHGGKGKKKIERRISTPSISEYFAKKNVVLFD
ncbi:ribonuclease H2 subunit A [Rhizophagus clarus]|uniref:Ribonuclease n=2 Tax=Rhizophagus clarus TaxID=94130 RepID=A0A8H3QWF3_9GLOM|nr:ribonuclease H2 subunit A [Rhizophagus clarus]